MEMVLLSLLYFYSYGIIFLCSGLQRALCWHLQLHVKSLEGTFSPNNWYCYRCNCYCYYFLLLLQLNCYYCNCYCQGAYRAPLPTLLFSDLDRKLLVLQNVAEEGFYRSGGVKFSQNQTLISEKRENLTIFGETSFIIIIAHF